MRNFYKLAFAVLFPLCIKAQSPTLSINSSVPNNLLCSNQTITLSARTNYDTTTRQLNFYSWSVKPANNVSFISPNKNDSTLQVSFLSGGSYTVYLTCGFSPQDTILVGKKIEVAQTALSQFNASFSTETQNQLILTNYSVGSIKNYWVFDNDYTQSDTLLNTIKNFSSGTHTVMLISYGNNNCNDTADYVFTIYDVSEINLPNIFSPNGDGVNDVYRLETKGIAKLSAAVYNRNGVQMWSWDKVNGFWDGHSSSGQACDDGVYFIVVEAEGFDGKTYKLSKTITLIH